MPKRKKRVGPILGEQEARHRRDLFYRTRGMKPGKDFEFGELPLEVKAADPKMVRRGIAVGL